MWMFAKAMNLLGDYFRGRKQVIFIGEQKDGSFIHVSRFTKR
jgi:hypothetical protein